MGFRHDMEPAFPSPVALWSKFSVTCSTPPLPLQLALASSSPPRKTPLSCGHHYRLSIQFLMDTWGFSLLLPTACWRQRHPTA